MKPGRIPALGLMFLAGLFGAVASVRAYPNGPPPGVTGGFGELTCSQQGCHDSFQLDAGRGLGLGGVVMSGFPKAYQPGTTYPIKLAVTHDTADRAAFGFQLAVRAKESGAQAGELTPANASTQIVSDKGIQYLEHTIEGTNSNVFEFIWVAPAKPIGDVVVDTAGNAANGDGSAGGDYIYSTRVAMSPAP